MMWIFMILWALMSTSVWAVPPSYQAQPEEEVNSVAAEHNNKGAELANQGRTVEAVREFRQAIKLVPKFVGAYYNLGRVYMQMKEYDDAVKCFAMAVQIRPTYGDGWYQLGIAFQMLNAFEEAEKSYLSALSYFPNDPNLLYRLGFVSIQTKDWAQAAQFWGRLRDEFPDHPALTQVQQYLPHLYFNLGTRFYAEGQFQEAEKAFLQTLKLDGGYGAAYYNLGLVYRDLKQFEEAQKALDNALDLNHDTFQTQSVLAHVHELRGSLKEAEALFQKLAKDNPQSLEPNRGLATVKLKQKDFQGALVQALNVVANAPQDPLSYMLLAYVYEHNVQGERYGSGFMAEQAITAYKRAIRLNKNDVAPHFNLGMLYGRLGDWEASVKALEKAQELDPNHAGVQKWLPDVRERYEQAR